MKSCLFLFLVIRAAVLAAGDFEIGSYRLDLGDSYRALSVVGRGPGMKARVNSVVIISRADANPATLPFGSFKNLEKCDKLPLKYIVVARDDSFNCEFEQPLLLLYDSQNRILSQIGPSIQFDTEEELTREIRQRWREFLKN